MVVREVLPPTALGFVTYTFLLMMQGLFSLAEQIFVRGLPLTDALAVLMATVPHVVVLTIPMGFLFGVLLAVGRMNADNEIIAMQAGGIAALRLLRPIVAVGVVMSGVCGYLFLVTIPQANRELRELRTRLFTSAKNIGRIEPRVFYDDFPNLLLYVQQVDHATGTWLNVLAFDSSSPGQERLTLARRGRVVAPSKIGGGAGVGAAAESGNASVARDG
jgi:lipopolysaccharide export LptBFGC system permease protein LptF